MKGDMHWSRVILSAQLIAVAPHNVKEPDGLISTDMIRGLGARVSSPDP